ncbi:MAG: hypothetical protein GAK39_04283 [Variovorax sp.]|nr:MAG: hypothetical protein GAK39_04283 [Variovorax sp.]
MVGALQSASSPLTCVVAVAERPVPGTVTVVTEPAFVAQIHGCTGVPAKMLPPRAKFSIASFAPVFVDLSVAVSVLLPTRSPVTVPSTRPLARSAKAEETSLPSRSTARSSALLPSGSTIST